MPPLLSQHAFCLSTPFVYVYIYYCLPKRYIFILFSVVSFCFVCFCFCFCFLFSLLSFCFLVLFFFSIENEVVVVNYPRIMLVTMESWIIEAVFCFFCFFVLCSQMTSKWTTEYWILLSLFCVRYVHSTVFRVLFRFAEQCLFPIEAFFRCGLLRGTIVNRTKYC